MLHRLPLTISCLVLVIACTGCAGDTTAPANPPAVITAGPDLAPPSVPTDLAAASNTGRVKLAWRPNTTDGDLAGYRIYRDAFGVTKLLAEVGIDTHRWIDRRPQVGTYRYAVTAVDEAGNESAWTTVDYTSEISRPEREAGS